MTGRGELTDQAWNVVAPLLLGGQQRGGQLSRHARAGIYRPLVGIVIRQTDPKYLSRAKACLPVSPYQASCLVMSQAYMEDLRKPSNH